MEKYINLFTDYGFKKVFGEEPNKDLLISFLNALLPAKHQIADLEYSRSEWQGVSAAERRAVMDLHCKAPDGTSFIVEVQKAKQNWFKDRSVYYASFPIQQQAVQGGKWDYRLSAVYSIGVLDFVFDDDDKRDVVHTVKLKNHHNAVFYDKLTFIYLTLPHFKKTLDELDSILDRWLYLFHHLPELQEMPPRWHEIVFGKLFQIAEVVKLPPEERLAYENSLKIYRDLKNVTDTAFDEGKELGFAAGEESGIAKGKEMGIAQGKEIGREEGMAQGIETGAQQKALETARKAIAMGLPNAQIAMLSGLNEAQIADLRRQAGA